MSWTGDWPTIVHKRRVKKLSEGINSKEYIKENTKKFRHGLLSGVMECPRWHITVLWSCQSTRPVHGPVHGPMFIFGPDAKNLSATTKGFEFRLNLCIPIPALSAELILPTDYGVSCSSSFSAVLGFVPDLRNMFSTPTSTETRCCFTQSSTKDCITLILHMLSTYT